MLKAGLCWLKAAILKPACTSNGGCINTPANGGHTSGLGVIEELPINGGLRLHGFVMQLEVFMKELQVKIIVYYYLSSRETEAHS